MTLPICANCTICSPDCLNLLNCPNFISQLSLSQAYLTTEYYYPYLQYLQAGEIYCITNSKTGQKYIGQTKCVKFRITTNSRQPIAKYDLSASAGRFDQHLKRALGAGKNKNDCKKFYEAIRQFGAAVWILSVLERCSLEELNARERFYVKYHKCRRQGYNMVAGGKKKPAYYAKKYKRRK